MNYYSKIKYHNEYYNHIYYSVIIQLSHLPKYCNHYDFIFKIRSCVFTRKLCVSCREDADGTVKVKVQSNALPNHCMNSTVNISQPQEVDWEVVWNADVTNYMNYSESDFDSSSKTDELLCDL